jgi:hypothetical protein
MGKSASLGMSFSEAYVLRAGELTGLFARRRAGVLFWGGGNVGSCSMIVERWPEPWKPFARKQGIGLVEVMSRESAGSRRRGDEVTPQAVLFVCDRRGNESAIGETGKAGTPYSVCRLERDAESDGTAMETKALGVIMQRYGKRYLGWLCFLEA